MGFQYSLLGMIIAYFGFDMVFFAINKTKFKLFKKLQDCCSKIQPQFIIRIIFYGVWIVITVFIEQYFYLNNYLSGFISGALYALIDMLFNDSTAARWIP